MGKLDSSSKDVAGSLMDANLLLFSGRKRAHFHLVCEPK